MYMQYTNETDSQKQERKKILLIVGALVLALVIITVIIELALGSKKLVKNPGDTNRYYDANSGETVSDPPNKTPENYDKSSSIQPLYLGFSKLLDFGVTFDQLKSIKLALVKYSAANNRSGQEFSIKVSSINNVLPEGDGDVVTSFKMTVDRSQTYDVKVSYNDLINIHLFIYDSASKLIYDSGVLNASF